MNQNTSELQFNTIKEKYKQIAFYSCALDVVKA